MIGSVENPKHRMMVMIAYGSGLRVSEIIRLQVKDIDSERMTIFVNSGKGNKDRYALLSKTQLKALKEYYKAYQPETWLFYSTFHKDKPLHVDSISKAYRVAKKKAGLAGTGGIHSMRHCFATHLLEDHVDIRTVQHLLGHADISSTMVYLHVTNNLVSSVQSPLDSLELKVNSEIDPFAPLKKEKGDE